MSRFVSAGSDENPAEQDEAWQKAHAAIEATRQKKSTASVGMGMGSQEGGKSLYETLQANKAAKQDAFEESLRLSNQFQSLNEDEVEFLDSVMESTRAQEAAVKKETTEQLDAFRRQQEDAERAAKQAGSPDAPNTTEQESWAVGKKRKKGKESLFGAVKLRKSSTTEKAMPAEPDVATTDKAEGTSGAASPAAITVSGDNAQTSDVLKAAQKNDSSTTAPAAHNGTTAKPAASSVGLGLAAYSSDEDD